MLSGSTEPRRKVFCLVGCIFYLNEVNHWIEQRVREHKATALENWMKLPSAIDVVDYIGENKRHLPNDE